MKNKFFLIFTFLFFSFFTLHSINIIVDADALIRITYDEEKQERSFSLVPGGIGVLEYFLGNANYEVCIFVNAPRKWFDACRIRFFECFFNLGLEESHFIVTDSVVPDTDFEKMYKQCLQNFEDEKDDSFFISSNKTKLQAVRKIGLKVILFDEKNSEKIMGHFQGKESDADGDIKI